MKTIVVALGGNAILKKGDKPNISKQFFNTQKALNYITGCIRNYRVVLTHGNGPQVGNILIRVEEALGKAYSLPLEICVAESEGEMGYLIQQTLRNILAKKNIRKPVVTLLTQVLIDKRDKSFKNPTKFIGPFYDEKQANLLREKGLKIKKDSNRGYRRVVPSPKPLKIVENNVIKGLLKNNIVIAAGGGGIPVYKKNNVLHGVEAVIDKDLASYVLARDVKAEYLFILTGVDNVYLNYGKRSQIPLKKIKTKDLKKYYKEGHFPEGSMGPKVEATIKFLENGGKKVIITTPKLLEKAIKGEAGTIIRN